MKTKLLVVGLVMLAFGASCSKCGKAGDGAASLTLLVPGDVAGVLVFGDLARTVADVNALLKKFSVGPLSTFLAQGKGELARRLGVDLFEAAEWKKLGVDPAKGLAVTTDPATALVIVGLCDQKAFEAELQRRTKELTSADQATTASVDGVLVTTLSVKAIGTPVVQYAFAGSYALLAVGGQDPKALARATQLKPAESLSGAKWYQELVAKIAADPDLLIATNGAKAGAFLARDPELAASFSGALALGFSIAPDGLSLDGFVGLTPKLAALLSTLSSGVQDGRLERYLPEDALFALKGRLSVPKLLELVKSTDPGAMAEYDRALAQAREMIGQDLQAATVNNLTGNAILGLSLGKPDKLAALIQQKGAGANLEGAFRLFVWAEVKDGKAPLALLQKALALAPEKFPVETGKAGPLDTLRIPTPQGFAIQGLFGTSLVGMCLGESCAAEAGALVEGKGKALPGALSPEARKLIEEPTLLAGTLSFGRLVAAITGLDASVFGEGGMMVKVILDLALGAMKNLQELTAVVLPLPDGVRLQAHLRIQ